MITCADSVAKARSQYHAARGGEIPASAFHFHTGFIDDANALVKTYHYSKRAASNVQFVGAFYLQGGLFGDLGECVAACCFSLPPTRWAESVLELSRLVRKDGVRVPLTLLIRLCCSKLKANGFDLLVSFADLTQGHSGIIYQAAGWHYHGKRSPAMDGVIINGAFVPGRSCNSLYGTRSPSNLRAMFPNWSIEPHYDIGKHLYWRPLNKSGERKAERMELQKTEYPKPRVDSAQLNQP